MDTANAFDMLILPILQCTAGILATFPILHGVQVGLGQLFAHLAHGQADHASR